MSSKRPAARRRAGGVALVMVLLLLALVTGVVTTFKFSSHLDLRLALGGRDELQAELNALSVLRMRALLLKQRQQLQQIVQLATQPPGGAQGQAAASVPLGPILQQIPVTCDLLNQLARSTGEDGSRLWEGDFFRGDCIAESVSEHGKIAVNLLAKGDNDAKQVREVLTQVLSIPALAPIFEADDRNDEHAESATALVAHLTDWVDADHNEWGGFGDEDRYYQYRRDPYRAKNAPLDSLAELRLVFGVNDLAYVCLEQSISVHIEQPKIELGTAREQTLAMGLMSLRLPDAPLEQALGVLPDLVRAVRQAQGLGGGMSMSLLQTTLALGGAERLFDIKRLKDVFSDKDDGTWYRIEAVGSVGRAHRRLELVFQAFEAQFYYARID